MTVQGAAGLRAVPSLTANPVLALDPQDAWRAYLLAYAKAQAAGYNWRMMRTAGGTDGTAGFLYGQFYNLDRQADLAYEAYLTAQKAAYPGTTG